MAPPTYHDEWDEIVARFIAAKEPFPSYWARSENFALELIDPSIRSRRGRLLDLGCGVGRLLVRYAGWFDEVVGIEADSFRIAKAAANVWNAGLTNVRFINAPFEGCVGLGEFDVVLCSHVIQHLSVEAVKPIMQRIHATLVPGGMIILLTAHSRCNSDSFKIWRASSTACETEVAADEFHRILADDRRKNALPIHAFGLPGLRRLLTEYELLRVHCFHALGPRNLSDAILFRDRWINWPFLQGGFGNDVLVAGQKV